MTTDLSVVIPLAEQDNPYTTLRTLRHPVEVVVASDEGKCAPFARNKGFRLVRTPLVLFCDGDISWRPGGVAALVDTLKAHPEAAYAYGAYQMEGVVIGREPWSASRLRANNFVSTMSVLRVESFPGWDESLQRLQDWDLWLTVLERGGSGVSCDRVVFDTEKRRGISFGGRISWEEARAIVARKHGLA